MKRCSAWAGMVSRKLDRQCRNTTEHPSGTCHVHRKCSTPGCRRAASERTCDDPEPRCYGHESLYRPGEVKCGRCAACAGPMPGCAIERVCDEVMAQRRARAGAK